MYCQRIKKSLKQQLYDVVIHGCINSKIICKEELKATGKGENSFFKYLLPFQKIIFLI